MTGKSVVDSLFILRATVHHAKYLNKELLSDYPLRHRKCFDGLWLEHCINSLWDLGVKDDTLFLIYLMNTKASLTIRTPMGDTYPLILDLSNFVKQETVLGPLLNTARWIDSQTKVLLIILDLLGYEHWSLLTILQTQAAASRPFC